MEFVIKEELETRVSKDSFVVILFEDNKKTGIDFVKNNKLVSKIMFNNRNRAAASLIESMKKRLESSPSALNDIFECLRGNETVEDFIFSFYTSNSKFYFNISQIFALAKVTKRDLNTMNKKDYSMVIEVFKNNIKIGKFEGMPLEGKFFFKKL